MILWTEREQGQVTFLQRWLIWAPKGLHSSFHWTVDLRCLNFFVNWPRCDGAEMDTQSLGHSNIAETKYTVSTATDNQSKCILGQWSGGAQVCPAEWMSLGGSWVAVRSSATNHSLTVVNNFWSSSVAVVLWPWWNIQKEIQALIFQP